MGRYDAQQLIANIELFLENQQNGEKSPNAPAVPPIEMLLPDAIVTTAMPPTWKLFNEMILPEMGRNTSVDKIMRGTRMATLKKALLRLWGPMVGPQSVFNAQALRGFEMMANHVDQMQKRMVEMEDIYVGHLRREREQYETVLRAQKEETQVLMHTLSIRDDQVHELEDRVDLLIEELETTRKSYEEKLTDQCNELQQQVEMLASTSMTHDDQVNELEDQLEALTAATRESLFKARKETDQIEQNFQKELEILTQAIMLRDDQLHEVEDTVQSLEARHSDILKDIETRLENAQREFRSDFHTWRQSIVSNEQKWADLRESLVQLSNDLHTKVGDLRQNLEAVSLDNKAKLTELDREEQSRIEDVSTRLEQTIGQLRIHIEGIDPGAQVAWVGEAFQSLQHRIGEVEGVLRESNARLLHATEYRSLIEDLLEKVAILELRPARPPQIPEITEAQEPPRRRATDVDWLEEFHDKETDLAYVRFQRQFRGDEKILRKRQREYLERIARHLKANAPERPRLLDVACGDGIFLELLEAENWNACGVDLNTTMARLGQQRGLNVEHDDAMHYLANAPRDQWDVITAFQFVEHLEPNDIFHLLRNAHRALAPGGLLIIETLNPHTYLANKWFQFDLTHKRLIFPEVMQLFMETTGFVVVEREGINEVPEWDRLKPAGEDDVQKNFERLNNLIYGPQDYYIIGRKTSLRGMDE